MSDLTINTKKNNISVEMRAQNITVYINRVGGSGVREVPGTLNILPNQENQFNTLQGTVRPRFISIYNSSGKRIDKNLPEPTVQLIGDYYFIKYTKQVLTYNNVSIYYV